MLEVINIENILENNNDLSKRERYKRIMYNLACKYYEYYGNLEVPIDFKTDNGYEDNENGKYKLGIWTSSKRSTVDPDSEFGKDLLKIGMRFERKVLSWDDFYKYASIYYAFYKNLEVPVSFRTDNGYEYSPNGKIPLGRWITKQREKISPTSYKGQKLINIGMIWNTKVNRNFIINFCKSKNIDTHINRNILACISVQELVAKTNFLESFGLNLVDENGFFHELYSLSNQEIQRKYKITIEQLINDYYLYYSKKRAI